MGWSSTPYPYCTVAEHLMTVVAFLFVLRKRPQVPVTSHCRFVVCCRRFLIVIATISGGSFRSRWAGWHHLFEAEVSSES